MRVQGKEERDCRSLCPRVFSPGAPLFHSCGAWFPKWGGVPSCGGWAVLQALCRCWICSPSCQPDGELRGVYFRSRMVPEQPRAESRKPLAGTFPSTSEALMLWRSMKERFDSAAC